MTLNDIEEEVILLKAVGELIDSMVNFEILTLNWNDPDSSILFNSTTHQKLFNIILVDFLSQTDKRAFIKQTSYLGGLKRISNNPNFNVNNSIDSLNKATREFTDWLEQEIQVQVHMTSINIEPTLTLSRINCWLKY